MIIKQKFFYSKSGNAQKSVGSYRRCQSQSAAITDDLAGHRAAITQGLNQLGQIINLPQVEGEPQSADVAGAPYADVQQQQIRELNLERDFTEDDFALLNENAFDRPTNFFRLTPENLNQTDLLVSQNVMDLTRQINGRNNTRNPTEAYEAATLQLQRQKNTFVKYRNAIRAYLTSRNYQVGQGIYPNQLIDRLKLLGGSIMARNNGVVPEFTKIAIYLNSIKVLPTAELKKMMAAMKKYLGKK